MAFPRVGVLALAALLAAPGAAMAGFSERDSGYGDILAARVQDLLVHRYAGNPDIVVFDIPTLTQQGEMFNRVVALVERIGAPRSRVMSNDELAQFIRSIGRTEVTFAFGNDFRTSELVVFFNLAEFGGISLNAQELALRDFLIETGLARFRSGFLQVAGRDVVVLSVPQEQEQAVPGGAPLRISAGARETILRHELSHGEYYANASYAEYCRRFWRTVMNEPERAAFRKFLSGRTYDAGNEEMMINETQAYLMHTPDPAAFSARKVGLAQAAIDTLRRRFLDGHPPTRLFADIAAAGR